MIIPHFPNGFRQESGILPGMKRLRFKPYQDQAEKWPDRGQVILAHYDDETVVVYLTCPSKAGREAAKRGNLTGVINPERTTWIRPGFLWVMHQSDWGTHPDHRAILAIRLRRSDFDFLLAQAINTQYDEKTYTSKEDWQAARDASEVLFQWDGDFTPNDMKLKRQVIQFGLRGDTLRQFTSEWPLQVEDLREIVEEQLDYVEAELLLTPAERVYPVKDREIVQRLGLTKSTP